MKTPSGLLPLIEDGVIDDAQAVEASSVDRPVADKTIDRPYTGANNT